MRARTTNGFSSGDERLWTLRGRDWRRLSVRARESVLDDCVALWRRRGFPHFELTRDEIAREFELLCNTSVSRVLHDSTLRMNTTALRLASSFHPNMWRVKVGRAHSPMERFADDAALRAMLRKALTIWPDIQSVNPRNLRGMLRTFSNTARVSNFRPSAAKAIYETLSEDGETVVDFSAGYGGRLVGCLSLRRTYIGIDPCSHQIAGLRRTHAALRRRTATSVALICAAAEDSMVDISSRSASLVFSSPPYFHHERYCTEPQQCCNRYPVYDDWLNGFVETVIAESHRILCRGGRFAINIADVGGLQISKDVLRLASRRFAHERTLELQLGVKPYLRARTGSTLKTEPVFVFRKK